MSWFRPQPFRKTVVIISAVLLPTFLTLFLWHTWHSAHSALQAGAASAALSGQLSLGSSLLRPQATAFEPVLTASDYRAAIEFSGSVFVLESGALSRVQAGEIQQTWLIGRDLPAAPLVSAAVRTGSGTRELWIATGGAGLITYDGSVFHQLLPARSELRKISALLPLRNGKVLIGTPDAGLYVSDGKALQLFHPEFAKTQITALAGDEDQFWVGTLTDGAWLWSGGAAVHFSRELPDSQVLCVAAQGDTAWVGTPLGVTEFRQGKFSRQLARGVFARALAWENETLWVGTIDQGRLSIPLHSQRPRPQVAENPQDGGETVSFATIGGVLTAVEPRQLTEAGNGRVTVAPAEHRLSGRHITAVHHDRHGRLWVGYFDGGLDIADAPPDRRVRHLEDDVLFCINRVKENYQDGTMAVATANGLALFDETGRLRQVLDRDSGLIASHVTDVLFRPSLDGGNTLAVATPAGLSFLDRGISSLYGFQGLINNHVYTLAEQDGVLYAGTLGGLSTLKNGLVQASFTTANSQLRQNWITASQVFGGRMYLGTYGSGVVGFDKNGDVFPFPEFQPRTEINPNAMAATGHALYAGTAGQGLAILRAGESRWHFITEGLPSRNVTALDEHNGELFVGTDSGLLQIAESRLLP